MTDCIIWQGYKVNGYGRRTVNNKGWFAHRYAYTQVKGPIPPSLEIDHLCFRTDCINPDHLEAVTKQENLRRSQAKHPRHPVTPPSIYPDAKPMLFYIWEPDKLKGVENKSKLINELLAKHFKEVDCA